MLDNHILNIMPNASYLPDSITAKINEFYHGWLSHPANSELNRLKNVMGVQTICNSIGIPLVEMPAEEALKVIDWKLRATGRDLMHPGREWNDRVAQVFLEKLSVFEK